jgi:hypothetical protein
VNGNEHRDIGDTASDGALVNVGGESAEVCLARRHRSGR